MIPIHDTYQIKMRDGKFIFVEVTLTESDKGDYAKLQTITMDRIFRSIKEQGYAAKDMEMCMPINSTDPAAREVIKATKDGMERLNEYFKNGGEPPTKE